MTTWKRQAIDHRPLWGDCFAITCRAMEGFRSERVIKDWIGFYNTEPPHSTLNKRFPDDAFFNIRPAQKAA
ncbi:hypothetical protein OAN307_c08610 [Octadecabacter antarcticus 307]|uniref:Uncharacterized protein n=1 Tax=Octadecabacter antarcticus 307 TaxID=391626 RepID=M9R2X1_9RHOB|nr:hypothetical protein OAN307_c08610 [Octadecabacter antarcticus 307]